MLLAGTENNILVRNYIVDRLRALHWHIEEDSFIDTTPYGLKNFTNVIATKDYEAPRRVILAAHFDSKFFSDDQVRPFSPATYFSHCRALSFCLRDASNCYSTLPIKQLHTQ